MTKTMQKLMILFIAILVATVFVLSFGSSQIAYGESFGGQEYSKLWYADYLNIETAKQVISTWDLTKVKSPIVIACIDTGINQAHSVFNGVLTRNENGDLLGYNSQDAIEGGVQDKMNIGDELDFHGTKVAGVMAMLIRELGLQDYIKIYPIKANYVDLEKGEKVAKFSKPSVANAINWAVEKANASVINMSFASSGATWNTNAELQDAMLNASKNAVLVAAVGNGDGVSTSGIDSATTTFYPAGGDFVLGVMGYGTNGKFYSTSNFGNAYDIVAPERSILTAGASNNAYTTFDGTSAAAPFVSVAAALLKLRYIVEGKLVVKDDGAQSPSGVGFETMLSNLNSNVITKSSYAFRVLDLGKVLTQNFSDADNYLRPSSLELSHNGTYGEGEYGDVIYQRADTISSVTFLAKINPFGKTNPAYEEAIEWYIKEIDVGKVIDEDVVISEKRDGNGLQYHFVAPHGGDYIVEARLNVGDKTLKVSQYVHIEYLPYYVGDVRITTQEHSDDDVNEAPSSGWVYQNDSITFGLTGLKYVDQSVEIRWYVNGEEVQVDGETYFGTSFTFTPTESGTYVISAKYGNRAEIVGQHQFVLTVKPTMSNPKYIALVAVGGVVVLGSVAAVVVVALIKKKKAVVASNLGEQE